MLRKESFVYHHISDEDLGKLLSLLRNSLVCEGYPDEFINPALKDEEIRLRTRSRNHNCAHERFKKQRNGKNRDRIAATNRLLGKLATDHNE